MWSHNDWLLNYYSCIIYASVNPTYIRIRGGRRQEGKNEGKKGKEGKQKVERKDRKNYKEEKKNKKN